MRPLVSGLSGLGSRIIQNRRKSRCKKHIKQQYTSDYRGKMVMLLKAASRSATVSPIRMSWSWIILNHIRRSRFQILMWMMDTVVLISKDRSSRGCSLISERIKSKRPIGNPWRLFFCLFSAFTGIISSKGA